MSATIDAIGTAATVGAVLVALFGPDWQARRHRPKFQIASVSDYDGDASIFCMSVRNVGTWNRANDVEAVLAAVVEGATDDAASGEAHPVRGPLHWLAPADGDEQSTRISLSPGAERFVDLAEVVRSMEHATSDPVLAFEDSWFDHPARLVFHSVPSFSASVPERQTRIDAYITISCANAPPDHLVVRFDFTRFGVQQANLRRGRPYGELPTTARFSVTRITRAVRIRSRLRR